MKDEHSQKPLAFGKRDSERILARNRFLLLCFTTHPGAFFEVVSSYCLCGGSRFAPARSSCNPPVRILYLQKLYSALIISAGIFSLIGFLLWIQVFSRALVAFSK